MLYTVCHGRVRGASALLCGVSGDGASLSTRVTGSLDLEQNRGGRERASELSWAWCCVESGWKQRRRAAGVAFALLPSAPPLSSHPGHRDAGANSDCKASECVSRCHEFLALLVRRCLSPQCPSAARDTGGVVRTKRKDALLDWNEITIPCSRVVICVGVSLARLDETSLRFLCEGEKPLCCPLTVRLQPTV
jgi:hypothetical protein